MEELGVVIVESSKGRRQSCCGSYPVVLSQGRRSFSYSRGREKSKNGKYGVEYISTPRYVAIFVGVVIEKSTVAIREENKAFPRRAATGLARPQRFTKKNQSTCSAVERGWRLVPKVTISLAWQRSYLRQSVHLVV